MCRKTCGRGRKKREFQGRDRDRDFADRLGKRKRFPLPFPPGICHQFSNQILLFHVTKDIAMSCSDKEALACVQELK